MIVSSLKEQYKYFAARRGANTTTLTSHQLTTQSTFNGSISAPVPTGLPAIPAIRMDEVAIKMDTEDTEGLVDDPSERHNGSTVTDNEAQFL